MDVFISSCRKPTGSPVFAHSHLSMHGPRQQPKSPGIALRNLVCPHWNTLIQILSASGSAIFNLNKTLLLPPRSSAMPYLWHRRSWSPAPSLCPLGSALWRQLAAPPSFPHWAMPPGGLPSTALPPASQPSSESETQREREGGVFGRKFWCCRTWKSLSWLDWKFHGCPVLMFHKEMAPECCANPSPSQSGLPALISDIGNEASATAGPPVRVFGALLLSFHSMRRLALRMCTKVSGPLSRKQNNSAWKATGFGQNEAVKPRRGSTPWYIQLFPGMLFFQAPCLTSQDSVKTNCCSSPQIQVLSYLSKLYGAQLVLSALFF